MPSTIPPTPRSSAIALSPLKAAIRALSDKLADLELHTTTPNDPLFKPLFDDVAKLWDKVGDLANKSKTSTISDFFQSIGSGVIEAQAELDKASEVYVRNVLRHVPGPTTPGSGSLADGPPLMGSTFRIPRVSAELKCSLETSHDKKLNLIFYSDRNDVRELHQQTVQLEVVAVPVSPDYLNYLKSHPAELPATAGSASDETTETDGDTFITFADDAEEVEDEAAAVDPQLADAEPKFAPHQSADDVVVGTFAAEDHEPTTRPSSDAAAAVVAPWFRALVTDLTEREDVRALIEQIDEQQRNETDKRSLVSKQLLPSWSRALVLDDGHNTRFILLAVKQKRPRLLVWQLVLRPAALRLLYQMPKSRKKNESLVGIYKFLKQLGRLQENAASSRR